MSTAASVTATAGVSTAVAAAASAAIATASATVAASASAVATSAAIAVATPAAVAAVGHVWITPIAVTTVAARGIVVRIASDYIAAIRDADADSDSYLSACLGWRNQCKGKYQTEQREYCFLRHFPDLDAL
jgi:hypothetical protein